MFMAVPKADQYRWVGRDSEADGARLTKVRVAPVSASWLPVNVSWAPETISRPSCDFPIFHPIVRCISLRAAEVLRPFAQGNLELLPINGLGSKYIAAHCIRWVEAMVPKALSDGESIHSTLYAPRLSRSVVVGLDLFGVDPMVAKLFVSPAVKFAVESAGLTGLEFYPVELA
jgi:hypothetical protein